MINHFCLTYPQDSTLSALRDWRICWLQVLLLWVQRENFFLFSWFTLLQKPGSLPKHDFPVSFPVWFTKNYWSNTDTSIKFFDEIIFPDVQPIKEEKGLLQEQNLLVIVGTFKGQGNGIIKEFCPKNSCENVIVPHNLTNKFQPLDFTANKTAKAFI